MTAVIELLGGFRAACFAALCVALSATLALYSHRLSTAQDELIEQKATEQVLREAQATNLQTISDLKAAVQDWSAKCSLDPKAASSAATATESAHGALNVDDTRRADDREKVYGKDKNAAEWGRVRVPGSVLERLRQ